MLSASLRGADLTTLLHSIIHNREASFVTLHYETRGGIAYFTIDNGTVNAFTPQMHKEFHEHLRAFDDRCRMRASAS